jgi:hypothetical protein
MKHNIFDLNDPAIVQASQLKAAFKRAGSHFFDAEAMRFFNSRLCGDAHRIAPGVYAFVTSERFDDRSPRLYTLRILEDASDVHSVREDSKGFQGYATLAQAKAARNAMRRGES